MSKKNFPKQLFITCEEGEGNSVFYLASDSLEAAVDNSSSVSPIIAVYEFDYTGKAKITTEFVKN